MGNSVINQIIFLFKVVFLYKYLIERIEMLLSMVYIRIKYILLDCLFPN